MKLSNTDSSRDFKTWGLKTTPQRLAVLTAVACAHESFTPQGLYERLKNNHATVGLTTVYRTLETFEHAGIVCRIESTDGERLYVRRTLAHHHHLVCSNCAQVVEFEDCTLSDLAGQLEQETGFVIHSHSLEFRGLCQVCRPNTAGNSREDL